MLSKLNQMVEKCGTIDLIIPVYNEETILESQLEPVLKQLPEGFTVTVVENGSTDATGSILDCLKERYMNLRVISLPEPSYGNAVKCGLENATAHIIMLDDLDVLDKEFWLAGLSIMIGGGTDMVQGSKVLVDKNDRRPFLRRAATRVLTSLLRRLLGFRGTDTHGPKIMKRSSFVKIFPLCGNEPDIYPSELIIRAQRMGLTIKELPIKLEEIRKTPLPLYKRIPRAIRDLIRMRVKLGNN